jgi:hypothetical protein
MKGKASILKLTELAKEQEMIEVSLSYCMLLNESLKKEDLDTKCQDFILKNEKVSYVDFEVDDAIDKLTAMKLISLNEDSKYRAVPMLEGIQILKDHYKEIFLKEIE